MSDALVARIAQLIDDERFRHMAADEIHVPTADLRALLTAYATVQADVQRLIALNDETMREWGEDVTRLRAELATLRETLAGEIEALPGVVIESDETIVGTVTIAAHKVTLTGAILRDRAITIIKGTT